MFMDLPEQQLYEAVRVCNDCFKKRAEMRGSGSEGDVVVNSNDTDRSTNGDSRTGDVGRLDSSHDNELSANMTSSPYGSPIKGAFRDGVSGGKTCSQESLSNESNTDTALLMGAKVS